jgi:hypothetical protein
VFSNKANFPATESRDTFVTEVSLYSREAESQIWENSLNSEISPKIIQFFFPSALATIAEGGSRRGYQLYSSWPRFCDWNARHKKVFYCDIEYVPLQLWLQFSARAFWISYNERQDPWRSSLGDNKIWKRVCLGSRVSSAEGKRTERFSEKSSRYRDSLKSEVRLPRD